MTALRFRLIKPKLPDIKAPIRVMEELVEEVIFEAGDMFEKTYQNWEHKPDFEEDVDIQRDKIIGSVLTEGEGDSTNPYPFITRGTSVRYATMTPGFKAKTKPRVISSGAGSGGVLYVDKRRPRPGIKAREFEEEIARRMKPKFERKAKGKIKLLARLMRHAI